MAGSPSNQGDIFDVKRIRRLVELMNEHELAEIDLRQADQRIRLAQGGRADRHRSRASPPPRPPRPRRRRRGRPRRRRGRRRPGRDQEPDGRHVLRLVQPRDAAVCQSRRPRRPDTTVCIIEAMKVFNEIPAEVSGQIVAVLVENGEPVEFGQPLFKVDPHK